VQKLSCSYCGKEYETRYIPKTPYCSVECRKRDKTKVCPICEKSFIPLRKTQMYCSMYCSMKYVHEQRHRESVVKRTRTCEACGKEFVMRSMSGKGNRGEVNEGRFCSKKCYGVWLSGQGKPKSCNVYSYVCDVCGKIFVARAKNGRLCSDECRAEGARRRAYKRDSAKKELKERKCKECWKVFIPEYGNKHREFCSDICARRYVNKINSGHARERAHKLGVYYEYVNPIKVFQRDGWRCQLCGKKLSPKHRGTYKDDAPELDHIIPWACGGEHSYRNTQCACRKCNGEKRAYPLGQLLLFG